MFASSLSTEVVNASSSKAPLLLEQLYAFSRLNSQVAVVILFFNDGQL